MCIILIFFIRDETCYNQDNTLNKIVNNRITVEMKFYGITKKIIHIQKVHLSIKYNYNTIQWKSNEFQEQ